MLVRPGFGFSGRVCRALSSIAVASLRRRNYRANEPTNLDFFTDSSLAFQASLVTSPPRRQVGQMKQGVSVLV